MILIEFDTCVEHSHKEIMKAFRNNMTRFLPREVTDVIEISNDKNFLKIN